MPKLTSQQRNYIRKRTKFREPDPSEMVGELNIIPFLDITVNLIMFLLIASSTVAFFSQVAAQLPQYRRGGVGSRAANPAEQLNLNVTVTENGVIVAGSGGKLAPGCENTAGGRVLTVPKKSDGSYDWEALTTCVARVKEQFPDETQVTVSADQLVEFQHLVGAMDAIRNQGENELFPDVMLSAGVR
ncbi:MAG: biopolymer transporter ExbD [Myxococcota bacterium]